MTRPRNVRIVGAIVALPTVVGIATWLTIGSFAQELPDPVATHWGAGSAPNGFSSRMTGMLFPSLFAPIVGIVMGVVLWAAFRRAPQLRRWAGAMSGFLSGMIGGIGVASLWIQRGLTDARQATDTGVMISVGLAVGVVAALAGAAVMPGEAPGSVLAHEPVPGDAPRVTLAEGERAAWSGWSTSTPLVLGSLGAMVVPLVVLVLVGSSIGFALGVAVFVGLLMLTMSAFRVTVGANALWVRSVVGFPRFHIDLDQVVEARVVDVAPLRDFGGWGIRGDRHGRYGVVLRTGPALEVRRGDGSRFVVTVDDAAQAAALLNTLADRARTAQPR